jgi:hypothetical protein
MGNSGIPEDPEEKHRLIIKLREESYSKLCDAVYKAKGFTPDAVPLPETIEKFGVMDDQARDLLRAFD